ncbi:LuxR C-terminal-related transcriptional regulator, partial [Glaesserella parasuis]|uniref:LuxR C-terminal-related transcriptional regulator n=1 Tax=Glaesserella parasuis TaxID=738 RepID=UPI003B67EA04
MALWHRHIRNGRHTMDISEIALANSECHLDAEHPTADGVIASALTAREIDVLEAMAKGLGCKDIAHTLGISEHTVRK